MVSPIEFVRHLFTVQFIVLCLLREFKVATFRFRIGKYKYMYYNLLLLYFTSFPKTKKDKQIEVLHILLFVFHKLSAQNAKIEIRL